jgi:hypothetical protein
VSTQLQLKIYNKIIINHGLLKYFILDRVPTTTEINYRLHSTLNLVQAHYKGNKHGIPKSSALRVYNLFQPHSTSFLQGEKRTSWTAIKRNFYIYLAQTVDFVGRSSVDIATGYGLDGPGIEPRRGWDFPHLSRPALGPTQPPVQ